MHRSFVLFLALALAAPALAKDKDHTKARQKRHAEAARKADDAPGEKVADATPAPHEQRGPTRIDFDDRLIQGQTNSAGSVYLYDRKQLELEPMVKKRDSFFTDVVDTAQGRSP